MDLFIYVVYFVSHSIEINIRYSLSKLSYYLYQIIFNTRLNNFRLMIYLDSNPILIPAIADKFKMRKQLSYLV